MTTRKFTTLAQLLNEAVNVAHTQIEKDLAQSFCFSPLVTSNKFPVSDTYVYYKKQEESVEGSEKEENKEKITKSDVGYLNEKTISIRLSVFDVF